MRKKEWAKLLAVVLSSSMIVTSVQTPAIVYASENVEDLNVNEVVENDDSLNVKDEAAKEESKEEEVKNSTNSEDETENVFTQEQEENKENSEVEKTEEETNKEQSTTNEESTAEEELTTEVESTTEEETTTEEDMDKLSLKSKLFRSGKNTAVELNQGSESGYESFTSDQVIAEFDFGNNVFTDSIYDEEKQYGFYDVDFNAEAKGWSGNVYYPRESSVNLSSASYLSEADNAVAVNSKVWTEKESTGYGVYTYENTSSFRVDVYNADYEIDVTLVNPTDREYNAYLEAEDITKATGINVAPGKSVKTTIDACVVDGALDLKFLGSSQASAIGDAKIQTVYVDQVKVIRKATNEVKAKPTIFIASDSTVQTYEKNYYPQTGWGQTLALFFGDNLKEYECGNCSYGQAQTYETDYVIVENRAIGGRSSKSFIEEGKLDDLLEDVKPGDYVFVQWGHNDATAARPNRYVSSDDFPKWMKYYINGARQRGATPVLVTPVARYSYTTNADGSLKSFASNFEAYRQQMLSLAESENVALVDLTQRSIDVCNNFGIEGSKSLFLHVAAGDYPDGAYANGATDSTHLQYYGAYKFAQCVAQGILDYEKTNQLDALKKLVVNHASETVPDRVTGLKITSTGATSISFAWEEAQGAELYYIYRKEVAEDVDPETVDFTGATKYSVTASKKYTDGSCGAGKKYVYAVAGFNDKGIGEFSEKVATTTKTAGYRYDFNYNNSKTMDGWIGVNQNEMYTQAKGYGWIKAPNNGRDRAGSGKKDASAMADDFNLGEGEFAVDLPNGDYEVTVYAADLLNGTSTIKPAYTAEGTALGSISCKQSLGSCTNTVRVMDGQLNLVVGGTNAYINGLTITTLLEGPTGLTATETAVNGSQFTFLLGFNPAKDAVGYKVYQKGTTDEKFAVVKEFTEEEYKADDLACKAMSVDLGDTYEFYMTCYTADGAESAPSNTITVTALIDTPKPTAPTNLVCVSPTEDATTLQDFVELKWDASTTKDAKYPVIKYIIYRSEKDENEKGFKEYKKVGEAASTTFKDTEVKTNISYYYKVSALNAGGESDLSEKCKTPVAGTLVTGGREKLTDRALVAINLSGNAGGQTHISATDQDGNEIKEGVYLSWRSFEVDFNGKKLATTFDVYCNNVKIASNLSVTNMIYEGGKASDTFKVVGSNDGTLGLKAIDTKCWKNQYLELQLSCPEAETMPDGSTCDFSANDMSLGDLDGDGQLELIVKWYPSNAKDNSGSGYTGKTFLDGYDINYATGEATLLWRIDMGVNIRSGAHYTQFQVWDFDCDGAAEIAVKTADGTTSFVSKDGTVNGLEMNGYVGACDTTALPTDKISKEHDYRNSGGYVLDGAEYFTIFDGKDAAIIDTTDYLPKRGSVSAWGDGYGNRVDRFLSGTAYLDGQTPYAVFCRGYYSRTCLTAYYLKDTDGDQIGDTLATYWQFDTDEVGRDCEAQGNHGLSINDIDQDGKDEIIYGGLVIDHDGTLKYNTRLGHGDAMHVSDWVSWNDGLEIFKVGEHADAKYQVEMLDAETGKVIAGYFTGVDTGRGVASDIDPTAEGAEFWATAGPKGSGQYENEWDSTDASVYSSWSTLDKLIALSDSMPAANATLFWDGDLLSEIQDHTFDKKAYAPIGVTIAKWNYETQNQENLLYSTEIWSNNGTKGNVGIIADFLGDWREEFITRCSGDKNKVRIYTTTIQTDYVVPCLLENLAYREGVAWENVAYNQPANLSYLLSEGLVTSQLSEGEVTANSIELLFTAANDGKRYGHDIEGYEIYRASENGEYELLEKLKASELVKAGEAGKDESEDKKEPTEPVVKKFDFGEGKVAAGWTQVKADASYSDEQGYGFTSTEGLGNKTYKYSGDEALTDVYSDSVLGWIKNGSTEFDVKLPNGKYNVTIYVRNGSGATYQIFDVNGKKTNDIRHGNSDITDICEKLSEVEVTDGMMKIVCNVTKNGYAAMYFSGIVIEEIKEEKEPAEDDTDKKDDEVTYVYVDKNLDAVAKYSYKVAAVVDGKTSFMSRPVTIETAENITGVSKLDDVTLVAGTPIAEGSTVASLLPQKVEITNSNQETRFSDVTWDVTGLDINVVGNYLVYGKIKGFSERILIKVTVVANEILGYAELNDISVIEGSTLVLPETVTVKYSNTTTKQAAVVWDDTTVNVNKTGHYTVKGIVTETGAEVVVKIHVVDDYIVSVETINMEAAYRSEFKKESLPNTVAVQYNKKAGYAVVNWNEEDIQKVDTSVMNVYEVTGTIEGYNGVVKANISVAYPILYRFDFGINTAQEDADWTGITVNKKGGKKTCNQLGIAYSPEKGYGFIDGEAVIEGRDEGVYAAADNTLSENALRDFVLPDGQTFVIDVPNGKYHVDIVSGSSYKSTMKATVEGQAIGGGNAERSFVISSKEVTVEDGQLTIAFTSGTVNRIPAVIIRKIPEMKEPVNPDDGKEEEKPEESKPEESKPEGSKPEQPSQGENKPANNHQPAAEDETEVEISSNNVVGKQYNAAVTELWEEEVPLAAGVNTMPLVNIKIDAKQGLRNELIMKYRSQNVYLAAHLGNGIGFTIQSKDADENINFETTKKNIPDFANGFDTFSITSAKKQSFAFEIGMHVNLGKEYIGKNAYVFKKNMLTGQYELMNISKINEIGNICAMTSDLTDFMVLIEK